MVVVVVLVLVVLVLMVAPYCNTYIRKRTVTDVLPPLLDFFKTLQVVVGGRGRAGWSVQWLQSVQLQNRDN